MTERGREREGRGYRGKKGPSKLLRVMEPEETSDPTLIIGNETGVPNSVPIPVLSVRRG